MPTLKNQGNLKGKSNYAPQGVRKIRVNQSQD
jgi:hypothetical protein